MDASSIITQVSRDDEQLNNFPEKGEHCVSMHLLPLEIAAGSQHRSKYTPSLNSISSGVLVASFYI